MRLEMSLRCGETPGSFLLEMETPVLFCVDDSSVGLSLELSSFFRNHFQK